MLPLLLSAIVLSSASPSGGAFVRFKLLEPFTDWFDLGHQKENSSR